MLGITEIKEIYMTVSNPGDLKSPAISTRDISNPPLFWTRGPQISRYFEPSIYNPSYLKSPAVLMSLRYLETPAISNKGYLKYPFILNPGYLESPAIWNLG